MKRFDVLETIKIDAPAERVRSQFGDVEHHAATGVHRGVTFELISDDGDVCRYRQTTRVGPLRLKQEFELTRSDDGVLTNQIHSGQFAGGAITFTVTPEGKNSSRVEAHVTAQLRGVKALAVPLLRRTVRRSLQRALTEDRDDIESGAHARTSGV